MPPTDRKENYLQSADGVCRRRRGRRRHAHEMTVKGSTERFTSTQGRQCYQSTWSSCTADGVAVAVLLGSCLVNPLGSVYRNQCWEAGEPADNY